MEGKEKGPFCVLPSNYNDIKKGCAQFSKLPSLLEKCDTIDVKAELQGKDEKFRMTNLEWEVDFFSMTNLVKTSSVGQI